MEDKCSECGKTCGSNAHKNLKGAFFGQILCGLCYNAYKTDLEIRWKSVYKEASELNAKQRDYVCDPYDPQFSEKRSMFNQIGKQIESLGKNNIKEISEKYHDLTGSYLLRPY